MKNPYITENFLPEEIDQLLSEYCDFLVIEGGRDEIKYHDFWSGVLSDTHYTSMTSKLLLDDYPNQEPDCFRWAFKKSLSESQNKAIKRAERDPFYRFRERLFDEDKEQFDKVMEELQLAYNNQLALNRMDPRRPYEYEHRQGLNSYIVNFIKQRMGERHSNPLSLFNATSIGSWREENIPNDNDSNVFDDIADSHGVQVAGALVEIVKKKFMCNIVSSMALKDVMDKTKDDVRKVAPEEITDILFSKSWYRTCTVVLPNYMTEQERNIFKSRHFSGVTPVYELKGSQISLRATASFARAITSVVHHENVAKGDATRPRNRPYGELRAKAPK